MTTIDANEKAKLDLAKEKAAAGIPDRKTGSKSHQQDSDDDEDVDKGDLDDDTTEEDVEEEEETEEDVEESEEEDSEDEDESDESNDDDEDEDDESEPDDKKIPKSYLAKEKAKREKLKKERNELRQQLKDVLGENKKLISKLPDDLDDQISVLAKEIGVEDPENLKKMIKFVKQIGGKDIAEIRAKLDDLMKGRETETLSVQYSREWKAFQPILEKEFPGATKEEIARAERLMDKLSHAPDIGGRKFKDADGIEKLDPYPLDYVLFKNRDKFEEVMSGKKKKGMETGRTQGITKTDTKTSKKLPKNASASDIRAREKEFAALEAGENELRSPDNSEI